MTADWTGADIDHDHDADYEPVGEVATHTGDTTAAHAASAVSFSPTGGVAATTVQAAIAEVDSEKSATAHTHTGTYEPVATAHAARHNAGGADALAADAAAATASLRTLGTGAAQAAAGTHAHSGTYVEPAIVDAKGDLLVGTAADTLARLAVGTNGFVLTADSAQTAGVKWAAAAGGSVVAEGRPKDAALTGGAFVLPGCIPIAVSTFAPGANVVAYTAWYVATAIVLDRVALEISTAGAAGKLVRIGIYNANTDWQPTSLVLDAGTVVADSLGVKTITINQSLAAGRYMACVVSDGAPTLRSIQGNARYFGFVAALGTSPFLTLPRAALTFAALPSTAGAITWDGTASSQAAHFVFARVSTP